MSSDFAWAAAGWGRLIRLKLPYVSVTPHTVKCGCWFVAHVCALLFVNLRLFSLLLLKLSMCHFLFFSNLRDAVQCVVRVRFRDDNDYSCQLLVSSMNGFEAALIAVGAWNETHRVCLLFCLPCLASSVMMITVKQHLRYRLLLLKERRLWVGCGWRYLAYPCMSDDWSGIEPR